MSNRPINKKLRGIMYVRPLTSYLRELRAIESKKPKEQQLHVPTLKELSPHTSMSPDQLSRLHNAKYLKLAVAGEILAAMNNRGFPMKMSDLIGYQGPRAKPISPTPPASPPIDIKVLASEFLKANEESREAMREAMPSVIAMIERHIAQQVAEANNN